MIFRSLAALAAAIVVGGCASTLALPPTESIRYHLGGPFDRGTIAVQPLGTAPPSLEYQSYADAVSRQLAQLGYSPVPSAAGAQYTATVSFTRANREGPPRRSSFSIGLGGGGFSGGRRGGGVGLGGGVGIPIGGGGRSSVVVTELAVTLARRADQSRVWEGEAHSVADGRKPSADAAAQAEKLAGALFTGFPGESGRTVSVK